MNKLKKTVNQISTVLFDVSPEEATAKKICLSCQNPINVLRGELYNYPPAHYTSKKKGSIWTIDGVREYQMSQLCEYCFDAAFDEDDCEGYEPFDEDATF